MEAHTEGGRIVVGGDARQRFYDARGYGYPLEGNRIALARVEAAHLLLRGDLDAVDGRDFRAFLEAAGDRVALDFLVYLDLRERGFYLSPAREGWVDDPRPGVDFVVYPRGKGPADDAVAHRVRVVGERETVPATDLGDCTLAVVDEESEVTYFRTGRPAWEGSVEFAPEDPVEATLLADRALCWDPPAALHEQAFYGQPLGKRDEGVPALQLSLVEAAQLVAAGALTIHPEGSQTAASDADSAAESGGTDASGPNGSGAAERDGSGTAERDGSGTAGRDGSATSGRDASAGNRSDYDAVVERGRAVEGERFDRRLQVYAALRERGVVPKTGFKFGADFRTYADVPSVDELGHSERLVRVLPADHTFDPRDVALDVRLAHGVRKQLVAAWPADGSVEWISIERLTP